MGNNEVRVPTKGRGLPRPIETHRIRAFTCPCRDAPQGEVIGGVTALIHSNQTLRKERDMDFGIALPTSADSWKQAKRAEELGFTHAWFYDTQMLSADCFVAMGAAAVKTSRIRLGTGVLIPSNRIAAVAASALMSLNALAPGRIDFGISTGFTARRTMGVGPIRLADMHRYIEQVQRLIAGETVEWDFEGARRKMRFLSLDIGVVNNHDPIPLHISALGPRARALTAELGAHWISAVGHIDAAKAAIAAMQVR